MMFKVELHTEVIKFLKTSGTVWVDSEGNESFVVNNSWYNQTDEEGTYTVQFIKSQQPE